MGPLEGHKKGQGWPHRINVYFLIVLVSNKHVYKIFLKSSDYFQKYEQKCEFGFRVQYPVVENDTETSDRHENTDTNNMVFRHLCQSNPIAMSPYAPSIVSPYLKDTFNVF